ncbi:MAG: PEP-utilizing enzyme [Planctomycetes bacterium]|nr:PEP-utilizing enzyme [Planctomycetota bacterium]
MSQARIVWLNARAEADEKTVGPKALGLVRLSRIGLTIPVGFCLSVDAYRQHVETNGILPRIVSALDTLATAPPERRRSILLEIREAIIRTPISEGTRRAVEMHYRKLGAAFVAVRSSATAEDLPGQSFAGQYDTYLGITDLDGCLAAIKPCWASLWTERAWDYRAQNGIDPRAVGMAVIVQALVPADASGVLFTADPAGGRGDRIIIEACFGLGEALVSGQVTPDRFLVRKRDLHLLAKTINNKAVESVLDQHGGMRQQPVAPERASGASIERRTVIRLARLAKRAEARLGGPQDMEWAVQGTRVFFLQARPITVVPGAGSWEDRQIWTNANLGEVLPDVMTPMTASFTDITDETLLRPVRTILGLERMNKEKLLRLIAGRMYFNASLGMAIIRHLPGAQHFDYQALVGGGPASAPNASTPDVAEEGPDGTVSTARMILRLPWSIRLMMAHRQEKARVSVQEMQKINCQLQDLDFSGMSLEELGRQFTAVTQDGIARLDLLYAVLTTAPLALLYKICERWLGDRDGSLANQLLADTGGMVSAQAGIDLWRLAAQVHETPSVRQVLLSENAWDAIRERLSAMEEARAFLKGWDRFMACHGHHCRGELEFHNQPWSETPDYVLKLLRGYLAQPDVMNPRRDQGRRIRQREQLQERCRQHLRNPIKRTIFNHVLRAARSGSVLRENFKNEGIRWTMMLRRILLEIGARLSQTGVLAEPNDVFFLELQELETLLHGGAGPDVRRVVADRQAQYEKNKSIMPPKVVVGRFDPDTYVPAPEPAGTGGEVLHGVAASAGMATGLARVILPADANEHVRAGEILVAPFTDPGWTPYFVPAAAIVTEQGGLLSHGSIIAREYGLPAVVNVPAATKIIRTGQRLQVDGNRGVVTILR